MNVSDTTLGTESGKRMTQLASVKAFWMRTVTRAISMAVNNPFDPSPSMTRV